MKGSVRRCFAALMVGGCVAATQPARAADDGAPAKPHAKLPLRYGSTCPLPGDPSGVIVKDGPKGPVVTFERTDLGALDTSDDNLALVSRRFFFKLRTDTELIEFQGRAEDGELSGLLSDAHGARRIALPAVPAGAKPTCERKP